MAERAFGIDFGTTNSLVATAGTDGRITCFTDETLDLPHPSVVWYSGSGPVVGRDARNQLSETDRLVVGDFVVSPKRLLGEAGVQHVGGHKVRTTEIVTEVLKFLKLDAERRLSRGETLARAVMTIPVKMDGRRRRQLREAAADAGIEVLQFVHEPLAALYAWVRRQPDPEAWAARMRDKPMLVFDWGGGTLDLTLCVVHDGCLLQIRNEVDTTVGGDFFDERLRNLVRARHAREHGVENVAALESSNSASRLRMRCEQAKISLSARTQETVVIKGYLPGPAAADLAVRITRDDLLEATRDLIERGLARIDSLLREAGCDPRSVELVLPTGGMLAMPAIREALNLRFEGRVADVTTISRGDRIIAEGAALIANDGLRLELSKPLEIEEADREYAELLPAGTPVPFVDAPNPTEKHLYCVDPRKGEATFRFVKPRGLLTYGNPDQRDTLAVFSLPVDNSLRPFTETLRLRLRLDRNCVAEADVFATVAKGQTVALEIVDLEFGIALPWRGSRAQGKEQDGGFEPSRRRAALPSRAEAGHVRIRSNVAMTKDWQAVPGDLMIHYERGYFNRGAQDRWTKRQEDQFLAYARCGRCGRRDEVVWREGCDYCALGRHGRPTAGSHLARPNC